MSRKREKAHFGRRTARRRLETWLAAQALDDLDDEVHQGAPIGAAGEELFDPGPKNGLGAGAVGKSAVVRLSIVRTHANQWTRPKHH